MGTMEDGANDGNTVVVGPTDAATGDVDGRAVGAGDMDGAGDTVGSRGANTLKNISE